MINHILKTPLTTTRNRQHQKKLQGDKYSLKTFPTLYKSLIQITVEMYRISIRFSLKISLKILIDGSSKASLYCSLLPKSYLYFITALPLLSSAPAFRRFCQENCCLKNSLSVLTKRVPPKRHPMKLLYITECFVKHSVCQYAKDIKRYRLIVLISSKNIQ